MAQRVSFSVPLELIEPELAVSFGDGGAFAAFVSVPEATVDERRPLLAAVGKVWASGKISVSRSVVQSLLPEQSPNVLFRRRVALPDPSHPYGRRRIRS